SITAGALRVKNNNSVGTGTINIGADGTFIINDELRKIHSTQFTRTITGTGTIQYTRQVDMNGDLSGFSGTIDQKGQHSIFSPVSGDASNVLIKNINVFCPVNNTDMLVKIGMINSGSGEIRPSSDAGTSGTVILQVGSSTAGNGTYAGSIMETEPNSKKLGVTKVGSNTWILTGGNLSYSGPTTVSDGMLQLGTEAILTTKLTNSAVTVSGGELRNYGSISKAITLTGGTLRNFGTIGDVNVTSGAPTIANNGSVTGTVTISSGAALHGGTLNDVKVLTGGSYYNDAGTSTVDLADGAFYYMSGGQHVFNVNSKITGSGTIYASSTADALELHGDLSEFTGTYIIDRKWNRGSNLGDNSANAPGMHVVIQRTSGSGDPLLTITPGSTANVGMISGTVGEIRPQAGGASSDVATFIVGNDTNYEDHTYGGTIIKNANSGKEIGITKTGSNTWTLTNASLTYGGPTAINGGTLEFTSTANLPNSAITLTGGNASAPATLKNAGTISKVVTVNNATNAAINNSGTLTAGVTLSGASTTLTLDGNVALNATAGTLTTLNVNSGTTTLNALKNGVRQIATINVANGAELTFTVQNGLGSNKFVPSIVLNGGTLKSGFDGFANLGPVTLNGGVITDDPEKRTTSDYQNYGSLLFSSAINVTDDASITAGKIMIRCPGSSDGGAGKFTVADGKTLTVSSEIRLSDSYNVASSLEKLGPRNMVLTTDAKLTGAV
ncbi:MAG: beta strand repeat-containing protein, partial [Thermoguttaceae bacterium]